MNNSFLSFLFRSLASLV